MITYTTTTNRTGRTTLRPSYADDTRHEAMEYVLGVRGFARTAGVRNAATAMRKQGVPLELALWILFHNPLRAANLLHIHWALTRDENLGDC
jgi:hypothetical protein